MFYDYAVTIPAGTAEASPINQDLVLAKGVIHRVEVEFYPGPRRNVSLVIMRGDHQLWPTNPSGVFSTDAYTIAFDEYLELKDQPLTLRAVGWSPNATYDHVVTVRIGILESKSAMLLLTALQGMLKVFKLLGIKV
jgi:hypothetical protein